jgi:signal transduction histidine kinase
MSTPLRLLLVQPSEQEAALLTEDLSRAGFDPAVERVETLEALQAALAQEGWDLVVADWSMPTLKAQEVFALLHQRDLDVPVIVVSVAGGEEAAVAAMKAGACDYLLKDNPARLVQAVERQVREAAGRRERKRAEVSQRQVEEQLRQTQKMDAIGKLTGGIAHDFNNLLTIVTGYSELVLSRLMPNDPLRDPVQEIKKAGDRAAGLTGQLLAFSRRQVLQPQLLDLNQVVAMTEPTLRRQIGADVELKTTPGALQAHVQADQGQLEQVILNLVANARDAMPHGGTLTIETADVELEAAYADGHLEVEPGPYALLAVTDTGCGMDAATRARLFEPFFTTKEEGKGMGLGLSTVYGIVKQSAGHIWVYSEPGLGTTFKIYLPRIESNRPVIRQSSDRTEPRGRSETILLVGDDEQGRNLVSEWLQANGHVVLTARDADEAFVIARGHIGPIHLLVADTVLPGMSGQELAEQLARERPQMKLLYLSWYPGHALTCQGVLHGAQGDSLQERSAFLQKPVTRDGLLRQVGELLGDCAEEHR